MIHILLAIAYYLVHSCATQTVFTNTCPTDSPESCSTSNAASCCFEAPGGIMLQTQFWDYSPATGPSDLFTLHGLWPDNCDGTYEQFCDNSDTIANDGSTIQSILVDDFDDEALYNNLNTVWKDINGNDHSLWAHEWNKHGTCINTIKASCYPNFKTHENVYNYYSILYNLFENLPTYKWLVEAGITPSNSKTYTKEQIQSALSSNFGQDVYFKCDRNNALSEVWYFHHTKGSLLQNNFVPIAPLSNSNCPASGILFPPKSGSGSNPTTTRTGTTVTTKTTTTNINTNTNTDSVPPTGVPSSGYIDLSGKPGCLISNGKYYTSGTCATYKFRESTASGGNNLISITSSKGYCGLDATNNNAFTCNSSIDSLLTQFQIEEGNIGYDGNFDWCLGSSSGSGSTAQTNVVLGDGTCTSFKLSLASK